MSLEIYREARVTEERMRANNIAEFNRLAEIERNREAVAKIAVWCLVVAGVLVVAFVGAVL